MVPDAAGVGAIPKLLAAQLRGLRERHEVTLRHAPSAKTPARPRRRRGCCASGLDAHILDRRRSRLGPAPLAGARRARRQLGARALALAGRLRRRRPTAAARPAGARRRRFDVVAVEDNPVSRCCATRPACRPCSPSTRRSAPRPASGGAAALRTPAAAAARTPTGSAGTPSCRRSGAASTLLQVFCGATRRRCAGQAPELGRRVRVNPYGMILPPPCDPARERPGTVLFTGTFAHLPNRDAARWLAGEIMPAVRARQPGARCGWSAAPRRRRFWPWPGRVSR